ncbi:helix-turn-helix domain-containing protein [Rheinheimera pleomorphica]|uniref:helix-turn-helix domain-containing protein n=1 Tax=Rheinheimera pleomorphica TaxID=2703963 RepID=UPI0014240818|nr:helix-turn-helix transcriptional regulator [Rheinheimera pleomorphica]
MKATPFGRYIRKLRIDHGVILKDLADALKVSSSYISALELGKKSISKGFVDKVADYFKLDNKETLELSQLASESQPTVKLDLKDSSDTEKELVVAFARRYRELTEEQQAKLKQLLEG